jgi:hypothetical protein
METAQGFRKFLRVLRKIVGGYLWREGRFQITKKIKSSFSWKAKRNDVSLHLELCKAIFEEIEKYE